MPRPQRRVTQPESFPAPLGGLNDIDPLANMGPEFCLSLNNWFPGNVALQTRPGYREWVTGLGLPVKTIMPYYAMSGDKKIFAATDAGVYDITVSMDSPPVSIVSTNGHYKHLTFSTVAGQYLVAVNGGTDYSLLYDGTTWIQFEENDTPSAPGQVKGVDPATFNHVTAFKRRLWFVQDGSMTAWYLPIDSVGGEAKPFLLGSVFRRGGKLLYATDWSIDGGNGLDNKLVFVSTLGEVAVYGGDNPEDATTWALEAVFYAAPPYGDRSFSEFGGDVLMITTLGLVPLTKVLTGAVGQTPLEQSLSRRISRTLNRLIVSKKYASNWDLLNLPTLQAMVIVIPPIGDSPAIQFAMNSLTGAWCRFDLPANCAAICAGEMYFGTTNGRVCLFGSQSYLDNINLDGSGGVRINCSMLTAFNYMGSPGVLKHWKLMKPVFQASKSPDFLTRIVTDFALEEMPGAPATPGEESAEYLWNQSFWNQAYWSSSNGTHMPWIGVGALGVAGAVQMKVAVSDPTSLVAIDLMFEGGGLL